MILNNINFEAVKALHDIEILAIEFHLERIEKIRPSLLAYGEKQVNKRLTDFINERAGLTLSISKNEHSNTKYVSSYYNDTLKVKNHHYYAEWFRNVEVVLETIEGTTKLNVAATIEGIDQQTERLKGKKKELTITIEEIKEKFKKFAALEEQIESELGSCTYILRDSIRQNSYRIK